MTDSEIIEVVQAHKEGKQIEYLSVHESDIYEHWHDLRKSTTAGWFGWDFQKFVYRVKPEEDWATHKFETFIGGKLQTHELRLPLNVTDDVVRQVRDGLKTLVFRYKPEPRKPRNRRTH